MDNSNGRVLTDPALGSSTPEPVPVSALLGDDPSREIERLYTLAKANNALARINADRAALAERKLAEKEGASEWLAWSRNDAIAKRDAMYLARQQSERALDRVKAAIQRRSVPTMDATYTAAFNAALDMVDRALRDSDGSPKGGDACGSVHDSAAPQGDRP